MKIFDTHAHYDDKAFFDDREFLLDEGLRAGGVTNVTNIGCDMRTSMNSLRIAEKYDYIYASIGVIPHHVGEMTEEDIDKLCEMAKSSKKVVAIGEIGLDYYYKEPDREIQKKWFVRQMELARELSLPIVIHSRDAAEDTIRLMKETRAEEIGGVIHCYSYSEEISREFLKMGFSFGIGGVVTFKNSKKIKKAVEAIPIENIVLETDSPYLTPTPFRGKRNDSRYLPYVIRGIAELKGISEEEYLEKLRDAVTSLFEELYRPIPEGVKTSLTHDGLLEETLGWLSADRPIFLNRFGELETWAEIATPAGAGKYSHLVTLSADPEDSCGTYRIRLSGDTDLVESCPETAKAGETVTVLTRDVTDGDKEISVSGADGTSVDWFTYQFVMPDHDVEVQVNFVGNGLA